MAVIGGFPTGLLESFRRASRVADGFRDIGCSASRVVGAAGGFLEGRLCGFYGSARGFFCVKGNEWGMDWWNFGRWFWGFGLWVCLGRCGMTLGVIMDCSSRCWAIWSAELREMCYQARITKTLAETPSLWDRQNGVTSCWLTVLDVFYSNNFHLKPLPLNPEPGYEPVFFSSFL